MDREDAIRYLERKDKLKEPLEERHEKYTEEEINEIRQAGYNHLIERKFTQDEEKEIKEVMKRGRIYGDPLVILDV